MKLEMESNTVVTLSPTFSLSINDSGKMRFIPAQNNIWHKMQLYLYRQMESLYIKHSPALKCPLIVNNFLIKETPIQTDIGVGSSGHN